MAGRSTTTSTWSPTRSSTATMLQIPALRHHPDRHHLRQSNNRDVRWQFQASRWSSIQMPRAAPLRAAGVESPKQRVARRHSPNLTEYRDLHARMYGHGRNRKQFCLDHPPSQAAAIPPLPLLPRASPPPQSHSSQINLSWSASTDNVGVTGYQIYRGGTLLTTVTGTSYSNTGLTPSTSYSYYVRATDAAGNFSGNSNTASATTQAAPQATPPLLPLRASRPPQSPQARSISHGAQAPIMSA